MRWIFFVLSILMYVATCQTLSCTEAENCFCEESTNGLQYMCSRDQENYNELLVRIESNRSIEIDCGHYSTAMIPENISSGFVESFAVRKCALTVELSFAHLMKRIGVTFVDRLQYDLADLENVTLKKEYFDEVGMELKSLSLDMDNIMMVEVDVFAGMPNLIELILNHNKIQILPGLFTYVPNLKHLGLAANNLKELPKGVFRDLHHLLQLDLRQNDFKELANDVFQGLSSLNSLELSSNKLITLPEAIFQSITSLREINLDENRLENIPEHIFRNSYKLQIINLRENNLAKIPGVLFKNLHNLEKLDLSKNKLKYLEQGIFDSLKKLKKLFLQDNLLNYIYKNAFNNLELLKQINLKQNKISSLDLQIFSRNLELEVVHISHNRLSFSLETPFSKCRNLEILDLSYNMIDDVPYDLIWSKVNLRKLNLSYNNITSIEVTGLQKQTNHELYIDLSNNDIKFIDFAFVDTMHQEDNFNNVDTLHLKNLSSVVQVSNNPIICDCRAYDLVRYINDMLVPQVKMLILFLTENLKCTFPPKLAGFKVNDLLPKHLVCDIQQILPDYSYCPKDCICEFRQWDRAFTVNCSNRNMTAVPQIYLPEELPYNQTEVYLQGNLLVNAPTQNDSGYENVTKLFLSRNKITHIDWVPPNIEELTLDNNKLSQLTYHVLKAINTTKLKSLSLDNNTWKCDCLSANLSAFLRYHLKEIGQSQVMCPDGRKLMDLNDKDLCETYILLILALSTIVACCFLTIAVGLVFFYCYQDEVKVWLFAHNMFLWWVTEEVIDKDKKYDAFICFSHKDEDFVIRTLMPVLEQGPQPYKICIHFRDWIAGEFIATQIAESVTNSRRTIIILSRSFLESVWGRIEFQTAHKQSMSEGRARVIVILYGDINPDTDLDDELKAYIRTNTYVKWGDPWFWNKIKYALPHAKRKMKSSAPQKLQNIRNLVDEKINFAVTEILNSDRTYTPGYL